MWKKNIKKHCFKFLISEKNIEMYAGDPKFAQELFFWSYHLIEEHILLLNNLGMYNYTAVPIFCHVSS